MVLIFHLSETEVGCWMNTFVTVVEINSRGKAFVLVSRSERSGGNTVK